MGERSVIRTIQGTATVDGAGVHLVRVVGLHDVKELDPFLMLDAFDSNNPNDYIRGFPWHPHRGIETVTYLVAGKIEHADSLGNRGTIGDGDCQWMTAGSGIIHQEMPEKSERLLGLQLWVNLPAKHKMSDPKYRDLKASSIPARSKKGCTVRVIAGTYNDSAGAFEGEYVAITMLDIRLDAASSCKIPLTADDTAFFYVLEGSIAVGPAEATGVAFVEHHSAALLSAGEELNLRASDSAGARCVFFSGKPLREGIAWGGPIVMNTREELDRAFRELDDGTFIKQRKKNPPI